MTAEQNNMFNGLCCDGGSGCVPVAITGSLPHHQAPASSAAHGIIKFTHTLTGSPPFSIGNIIQPGHVQIVLSGNNVVINVEVDTATRLHVYNIGYTVWNCGGSTSTDMYAGTFLITDN